MNLFLPTLTVLIPAHNEEKNIEACIKSILEQNQTRFILKKILVISDGSTDSTVEKVKNMPSDLIDLVVWKKNQGQESAINYGFRNTLSDFIFKIDGDLTFTEKTSLDQVFCHQKETWSDLLFVGQKYKKPKNTLLENYIFYMHGQVYKKELLPRLTQEKYQQTHVLGSYLIKKDLFQEIYFPDKPVPEDVFIFYTAKNLGAKTSYTEQPYVFFAYPKSWKHHIEQITRWDTPLSSEFFSSRFLKKYDTPLPFTQLTPLLIKAFLFHPFFVSILIWTRTQVIIKKIQRKR